jgi:predicted house-cleaning noncanonical NTP pyrophosphatase (MazG superfamily)
VSLDNALERAEQWILSRIDNGQNVSLHADTKASHEIQEFIDDPSLEELADVFICLQGVMVREGWSIYDVSDAIYSKVEVLFGRQWNQNNDGTWSHIKEESE